MLVSVLIFAGFAASAPNAIAAQAKPIKLTFAYDGPADDPESTIVYKFFCREVERRAKGRVKVAYYPGGALGKMSTYADLLDAKTIDIGMFVPAYVAGRFPLNSVMELPYVFPTSASGSLAYWELYKRGWFDKEFAGLKPLWLSMLDLYHWGGNKRIARLADVKGTKVRVPGAVFAKIVKRLGGTPVSVPFGEVYLALEKGTVDMAYLSYGVGAGYGLAEVCPYVTELGTNSLCWGSWMNREVFEGLPKDIQGIIEQVGYESFTRQAMSYDIGSLYRCKDVFIKHGAKIVTFPQEDIVRVKKLLKPVWDEWIKEMEGKGLPGKDIVSDLMSIREELRLEPLW